MDDWSCVISFTKFKDEKLKDEIISYALRGFPTKSIANNVGISKQSLYTWLSRGRKEENTDYSRFAERFYAAKAQCEFEIWYEGYMLAKECEHPATKLNAIKYYLKQMNPEQYTEQTYADVKLTADVNTNNKHEFKDDKALWEFVKANLDLDNEPAD